MQRFIYLGGLIALLATVVIQVAGGAKVARATSRTTVVLFSPLTPGRDLLAKGYVVSLRLKGSCSHSRVIGNVTVVACLAGRDLYDPCWPVATSSSGGAAVCPVEPWRRAVVEFSTPAQLPRPVTLTKVPLDDPWAMELTNGQTCFSTEFMPQEFRGKLVDYDCTNGLDLLNYRTVKLRFGR